MVALPRIAADPKPRANARRLGRVQVSASPITCTPAIAGIRGRGNGRGVAAIDPAEDVQAARHPSDVVALKGIGGSIGLRAHLAAGVLTEAPLAELGTADGSLGVVV